MQKLVTLVGCKFNLNCLVHSRTSSGQRMGRWQSSRLQTGAAEPPCNRWRTCKQRLERAVVMQREVLLGTTASSEEEQAVDLLLFLCTKTSTPCMRTTAWELE